jgi:hypothetical protein
MKRILAALLAMLVVVLLQPQGVSHRVALAGAAPLPPFQVLAFHQVHLGGSAGPDEAIIDCSCMTAHDRILVYDPYGDMVASSNWRIGTNISDSTWIIDVGARGRASLIIQFATTKDQQTASLYDDVTGNGEVSYHLDQARVIVDESPYWTVRVTASPRWFLPDGQPNLNIHVLMDGPFPNAFAFLGASDAARLMHHDGVPDFDFTMWQNTHTGIANYALSRLLDKVSPRSGIGRSRLWVNVGRLPSQVPDTALLWPFLAYRPPSSAVAVRAFMQVPQVSVDWSQGVITGFALPGYPAINGYWINDTTAILPHQTNDISFEAPHAWYNLAQDNSVNPDLNIRIFDNPGAPWQEIRYSWIQFNQGTLEWDYKLGMMGSVPITTVVNFPDFKLRMVPYAQIPYWVTSHTWDLNTFVAREGGKVQDSEGIYYWTPWNGVNPIDPNNPSTEAYLAATAYLSGDSLDTPARYFTSIPVGYRGEYNLTRPLRPMLYFSPIDRRLHLLNAERGLLNVDGVYSVTYRNDGGAFLDQWSEWKGKKLVQSLYKAGQYLVYAGPNGIVVKRTAARNATFETLPPRNHAEWVRLGSQLTSQGPVPAATDFRAMFNQFRGPAVYIPNAQPQEYRRLDSNGFRFVFTLRRSTLVGAGGLLPARTLAPGTYVFIYDGHAEIALLTPPAVTATLTMGAFTQLRSGTITVVLHNTGLQDTSATLDIWATSSSGKPAHLIIAQPAVILGDQSLTLILGWAPSTGGPWTLLPQLKLTGGRTLTLASKVVVVGLLPSLDFSTLLTISTAPGSLALLVLGLLVPGLLWVILLKQLRFPR